MLRGDLLVDSVMGVKYFMAPVDQFSNLANSNDMTPPSSYRPDISFYTPVKKLNGVKIYQNLLALSLGFAASKDVISADKFPSSDFTADDQSYLLNKIVGSDETFFEPVNYQVKLENCSLKGGQTGLLQTINKNESSSYELILENVSAEPYYVQLTTDILWNAVVTVNENGVPGVGNGSQPMLFNVCANSPGSIIKVKISPYNGKPVSLNDLIAYKFNISNFEKTMRSVMNNQLQLTYNGKLQLCGTIDMPGGKKDVMMTSIPYNKGWTARVDGQKVKTYKAFNTFVAIKVPKGKHHIELSFWPPLLTAGIIVSLITWLILALCWKYEKSKIPNNLKNSK